jgi:hypothetical protein
VAPTDPCIPVTMTISSAATCSAVAASSLEPPRRPHRPVLHDRQYLILVVGKVARLLDELVERLKAKAPKSPWWPILPYVARQMSKEMVLWLFQALVFFHLRIGAMDQQATTLRVAPKECAHTSVLIL